jgi:hypothetical protein
VHQTSLSNAFRQMGATHRLDRIAQLRTAIVSRYLAGESTRQLADAFGLTTLSIGNYLKAAGVPLRSKAGQRGLVLPDNVLNWDWTRTEAGAWACWMIVTDGSLRLNNGRLSANQLPTLRLVLAEYDREGVELFAKALGVPNERVKPVRQRNRTTGRDHPGVGVEFTHPRLWFLHRELGMPLGDKTAIAALPECLVQNRHAWRGVFDGDGGAHLGNGPTPAAELSLFGVSPALHRQFAAFAAGLDLPVALYERRRKNRAHLQLQSIAVAEPAARLADELYRDAVYTIPRKRDRAWAVREARFNKPGRAPRRPRVTPDEAEAWLSAFNDGAAVRTLAEQSGRSFMTVQAWLRKLGAEC